MFNLDHSTLLTLEVVALVVLVALGIWRLSRQRVLASAVSGDLTYDMRRDGPRYDG